MGAMTEAADRIEVPTQLADARAIVLLPACSLDEAIAPIEVLLQEGLSAVSLPPDGQLSPTMLRNTFGRRLFVGVHDLRTAEHAAWAASEAAGFALSMGLAEVSQPLADAALAHFPAALTPTEVSQVWLDGASGVQLVPAGLFGNSYAAQLTALVPEARLIVRGAESTYEVRAWLEAGAVAICLGERTLGDAFRRGDLSSLRTRVRPIVDALRRN